MKIEDFKKEIYAHYFDQDLQVTIDRDPGKWSTLNGLLHAGLFYTICAKHNAITDADRKLFSDMVDRAWVDGYPGLLERHDKHTDVKQGHDDYIGVAAASYFLRTTHAIKIYEYGQKTCFRYDNQNPEPKFYESWSSAQGRFPWGQVGFYALAAKEPPSNIQTVLMIQFLSKTNIGERPDSGLMGWLRAQVIQHQSSRFNEALNIWNDKFYSHWGTLANCAKAYFGEKHPMAELPEPERKTA